MDNVYFNRRTPHIIVVDDFYKDPDNIRAVALQQEFKEDNTAYKGGRSAPFLFPWVKEEFERLIGVQIYDWMSQPMNGVFQMTAKEHPLVYHSDTQNFAAAIYLTPDAEQAGTSFWKDKKYGCRRPPSHPLEKKDAPVAEIYSKYNLLHEDNWELIDRVGAVYNRLVIWDAQLIHSATSYQFGERLVQLFFFNISQ